MESINDSYSYILNRVCLSNNWRVNFYGTALLYRHCAKLETLIMDKLILILVVALYIIGLVFVYKCPNDFYANGIILMPVGKTLMPITY